jgi:hypothetical protein
MGVWCSERTGHSRMDQTWIKQLNPWQLQLVQWGVQTVAYAMSKRAMAVGRPFDGPEKVRLAWDEALALVGEMWGAACAQADPVDQDQVTRYFAERVLDWTVGHLSD